MLGTWAAKGSESHFKVVIVSAKFEGRLGREGGLRCAITITNRHDFASFDVLDLEWEWVLECEGVVVEQSGKAERVPPAAPGGGR